MVDVVRERADPVLDRCHRTHEAGVGSWLCPRAVGHVHALLVIQPTELRVQFPSPRAVILSLEHHSISRDDRTLGTAHADDERHNRDATNSTAPSRVTMTTSMV